MVFNRNSDGSEGNWKVCVGVKRFYRYASMRHFVDLVSTVFSETIPVSLQVSTLTFFFPVI